MLKKKFAQIEFITLMASLMAISALAIDAILPSLDAIGITIGITNTADNQLLITMIFLGLGIGPLFIGPISDSFGRKPAVYIGFLLFLVSSFICIFARSIEMMIIGRILQGIGVAAPRTIAVAMVRDIYTGDYMARIMSFITVIFLIIPIIAPSLGKLIQDHYEWQAIFYMQLICAGFVCLWFWRRQEETLAVSKRIKFTSHIFWDGLKEILMYKTTIGYTLISGFIMGSFMVYLSASQQIFEEQYQLKNEFPYIFGLLAIAIGCAIFLNGTFVLRFGMKKLITAALFGFTAVSLLYVILFYFTSNPSIYVLLLFFSLQFFAVGFLFGNLRAIAMEPIGHIAGIGAAITGFVSTIMAVPIGTYIGRFVVNSALPLFIGFLICGIISLAILYLMKLNSMAKK